MHFFLTKKVILRLSKAMAHGTVIIAGLLLIGA